jgi:Flp pilus assembly protein TadD
MTLRRIVLVGAMLACLELLAFEWRYRDLVYWTRPVALLAQEPKSQLDAQANRSLARPTLTRAKLEAIVTAARVRNDRDLAVRALVRLAHDYPVDAGVQTRLGDALREAGRVDEARHAYESALALVAAH